MNKFALMQPYFIPYLGYWQLFNEVDVVVISDDTKYVKQSWINRNRLWVNGKVEYITIPLKKDSDFLSICQRQITSSFNPDTLMQKIMHDYRKCENPEIEDLVNRIIFYKSENLAIFLQNSITEILQHLNIDVELVTASSLGIPLNLRGKERIFYLANKLKKNNYVNLPGGRNLYSKQDFYLNEIDIQFICPRLSEYGTKIHRFTPGLSILDLCFNVNDEELIKRQLADYTLE